MPYSNNSQNKRFLHFEVLGIIIVCILAPVFHFLFAWSGNSQFVGLFAAVNESVWEHTKIVYFPFLFYSIIEYFVLKPDFRRFFVAKTISMSLILLLMVTFFYTYTGMFGMESLTVDIIFTFVLTILVFYVSYHLYFSGKALEKYFCFYLVLFIIILAMELLFTAFPPHIPLFQDSETLTFGFPA
ncbi:MAG: DUF6512 family protein [Christensenella sp.]|nr:DUF6512 family protein [Christensenella sp.]